MRTLLAVIAIGLSGMACGQEQQRWLAGAQRLWFTDPVGNRIAFLSFRSAD